MIGTITATRLNVRALPNQNSHKLGELVKGTVVEILGQHNKWFEIRFKNIPAFIYGDYVNIQERTPNLSGVTTASLLNIRDRPSSEGVILGTLASGSLVQVLSHLDGWLEIPFNTGTAFISSAYVKLHEQDLKQRGVVTAGLLNIRSNPQANASIIGQLQKNTEVVIESILGDWYEIPFNNGKGYVSIRYIQRIADMDMPSPIPIAMNQIEDEDESPQPMVAHELTDESATLFPASRLSVGGTEEEHKVATTWNRFGGLLERLSDQKNIDAACAVAVLCVESSGRGFDPNNQNRMIIRFENHKFWQYWGKTDPDQFHQHFTYNTNQVWKGHKWRKTQYDEWQTFHGIQRSEWEVLDFARAIDNNAALTSISMGAPQIMGFHYEKIGYQSVQEMFDAFSASIEAHITGMFDFMSSAMISHLQRRDFTSFAKLYNGSGQKEQYGRRIKKHYEAFKRLA